MQITETLLAEQGDIRRFIQQAVDHLPRLLVIHFMLHSAEGSIAAQQIHAFYREFHRQVNTRVIQRSHTGGPSPSVVLRWLQEKHCGSTMCCVLLLSQDLFLMCYTAVVLMQDGKLFSGCAFRYIRSVCCVKNSRSHLYVTDYDNNYSVMIERADYLFVDSYGLIKNLYSSSPENRQHPQYRLISLALILYDFTDVAPPVDGYFYGVSDFIIYLPLIVMA